MTETVNLGLLNHNSALCVADLNCQFDELSFVNAARIAVPTTIKSDPSLQL